MNTKKQLTLAWTIAAILAVLLVIAVYFVMYPKKDLGTVLQEGRNDIVDQRERVRQSCSGTDAESKRLCDEELTNMIDILQQFSKDIKRATSTVPTAQ